MNRRDFLKTLAALPGLAFLRPELPELAEPTPPIWDTECIYIDFGPKKGDVRWNGLGESWTYDGKEWIQTEFGPIYTGSNVIFAGGDFSGNGYIAIDGTGEWVPVERGE